MKCYEKTVENRKKRPLTHYMKTYILLYNLLFNPKIEFNNCIISNVNYFYIYTFNRISVFYVQN